MFLTGDGGLTSYAVGSGFDENAVPNKIQLLGKRGPTMRGGDLLNVKSTPFVTGIVDLILGSRLIFFTTCYSNFIFLSR